MNRNKLIQHVELWKAKLGSYAKVAEKCNINVGALSTILAGKYGADETKMLAKIAVALNYKELDWVLVRTIKNYRDINKAVHDAMFEKLWIAISNIAGSGKTGTLEDIFNNDVSGDVTFIQAKVWSARQFVTELAIRTIGINALKGKYKTITDITQLVSNYFNEQSIDQMPVLFIDEFDKLKPAAKLILIDLYNNTEDRLGLIACGTDAFEKEMKAGVRLAKKGYDELDSRFARTYLKLKGATQQEVKDMCQANGIVDEITQDIIWNESEHIKKPTRVRTARGEKEILIEYVEDLRRIKRLIKRELLMQRRAT